MKACSIVNAICCMCVGCKVDVILSDQDPQVPLEPSRGQGQNASVTTYFRFSNLWKKNCLSSFDKIFCTSRSPEIDFHANFSVKSHSAVISRFFFRLQSWCYSEWQRPSSAWSRSMEYGWSATRWWLCLHPCIS